MRYLLVLLLTGCSGKFYFGGGLGKNSGSSWEDQDSIGGKVEAGYMMIRDNYALECGVSHYSQPLIGKPFNDKNESALDHYGCGGRLLF